MKDTIAAAAAGIFAGLFGGYLIARDRFRRRLDRGWRAVSERIRLRSK